MVKYECEICNKNFGNFKSHYENHINKKFYCKNTNKILSKCLIEPNKELIIKSKETKSFKCEFCNKFFTRKDNLNRHINTICKKNIETNEQINELIEFNKQLIKQNEENNKQIKEIKKQNKNLKNKLVKVQVKRITNSNNVTNSNNTTNINVQINKYGTENYNELDNKLFLEPMLKEIGKQIFLKQIQNIYINPDLPQNHNIVITDKNRQICKVHDGERWKTTNIKIINDLLTRIIDHSKTKYNEYIKKYAKNEKVKNKLVISKKYIDRCDLDRLTELEYDLIENIDEINLCKDFYEMVYSDIVNLLHDYKDIIIK